ncbi:MAG: SRPBCC family protein [Acidobacteriaceae bacterium]
MVSIEEITTIHAPIQRCFDLSRSIDLHLLSTARTGERAVAGVTTGLIGLGERVTWRAKHLGLWQELTSEITAMDSPVYFRDAMVRGAFRSFEHEHSFTELDNATTEMKDVLRFAAPIPLLGRIAEIFLRPYLSKFLRERNEALKTVAEGEDWRRFL